MQNPRKERFENETKRLSETGEAPTPQIPLLLLVLKTCVACLTSSFNFPWISACFVFSCLSPFAITLNPSFASDRSLETFLKLVVLWKRWKPTFSSIQFAVEFLLEIGLLYLMTARETELH